MAERATTAQVRIEPWAEHDLELLRQANAPEMTEHLGGPETEEQVLARHQRYLAIREPGAGGMFSIILLPDGEAVGTIGYWERETEDTMVYETGWGVLPPFLGRGIASSATEAVIAHARQHGRHRHIHAYPSIDNLASNAVCRKLGFEFIGEFGFEYPPGNPIRCNDWRLDLTATTRE